MEITNPGNLDLFLCSTQNFRIGTYVTIGSLLAHLNPTQKTTIHLLSKSLEKDTLDGIRCLIESSGKKVELDYQKVDLSAFSEIHECQTGNGAREFSDDIYARLLIPTLFPEIRFGIYLDSDMLIQRDLSELLELSQSATPLFAVRGRYIPTLSHPGESIDWKKLKLNPDAPYFNSGFLVMNMNYWDREGLIPTCQSISQKTSITMPDQGLLNIIFAEKWSPLESKWNHLVYPEHWDYAYCKSNVNYHFIGEIKPWIWPQLGSIGCVRKVHRYINRIPKQYREDYHSIRKPYPLFLGKYYLKKLGAKLTDGSNA
jgi:lipopolysaccharide biosynthesis glycosyltransferase